MMVQDGSKICKAAFLMEKGVCSACGERVSLYGGSQALTDARPKADGVDWWEACDNPDCIHREGEEVGQFDAAWVIPDSKMGDRLWLSIAAPSMAGDRLIYVERGWMRADFVGCDIFGKGIQENTIVRTIAPATCALFRPNSDLYTGIVISKPTTLDHVGNGSEKVVILRGDA